MRAIFSTRWKFHSAYTVATSSTLNSHPEGSGAPYCNMQASRVTEPSHRQITAASSIRVDARRYVIGPISDPLASGDVSTFHPSGLRAIDEKVAKLHGETNCQVEIRVILNVKMDVGLCGVPRIAA